jgi:DNA-directed RNA polymerase subunit beta'
MINIKNFTPIVDGLFCERIFGPVSDFECICKKYKKKQIKIKKNKNNTLFCNKCNTVITESYVRNFRLG